MHLVDLEPSVLATIYATAAASDEREERRRAAREATAAEQGVSVRDGRSGVMGSHLLPAGRAGAGADPGGTARYSDHDPTASSSSSSSPTHRAQQQRAAGTPSPLEQQAAALIMAQSGLPPAGMFGGGGAPNAANRRPVNGAADDQAGCGNTVLQGGSFDPALFPLPHHATLIALSDDDGDGADDDGNHVTVSSFCVMTEINRAPGQGDRSWLKHQDRIRLALAPLLNVRHASLCTYRGDQASVLNAVLSPAEAIGPLQLLEEHPGPGSLLLSDPFVAPPVLPAAVAASFAANNPHFGVPQADPLQEEVARCFIFDLLKGLDCLHEERILHGELSLGHLYAIPPPEGLIADDGSRPHLRLGGFCCPTRVERVLNTKFGPGLKEETWSVGVCAVQMLSGRMVELPCPDSRLRAAEQECDRMTADVLTRAKAIWDSTHSTTGINNKAKNGQKTGAAGASSSSGGSRGGAAAPEVPKFYRGTSTAPSFRVTPKGRKSTGGFDGRGLGIAGIAERDSDSEDDNSVNHHDGHDKGGAGATRLLQGAGTPPSQGIGSSTSARMPGSLPGSLCSPASIDPQEGSGTNRDTARGSAAPAAGPDGTTGQGAQDKTGSSTIHDGFVLDAVGIDERARDSHNSNDAGEGAGDGVAGGSSAEFDPLGVDLTSVVQYHSSQLDSIITTLPPLPPLPSSTSDACLDFISLCFQIDRYTRPTAQQLLSHKWLSPVFNQAGTGELNAAGAVVPNSILHGSTPQPQQALGVRAPPVPAGAMQSPLLASGASAATPSPSSAGGLITDNSAPSSAAQSSLLGGNGPAGGAGGIVPLVALPGIRLPPVSTQPVGHQRAAGSPASPVDRRQYVDRDSADARDGIDARVHSASRVSTSRYGPGDDGVSRGEPGYGEGRRDTDISLGEIQDLAFAQATTASEAGQANSSDHAARGAQRGAKISEDEVEVDDEDDENPAAWLRRAAFAAKRGAGHVSGAAGRSAAAGLGLAALMGGEVEDMDDEDGDHDVNSAANAVTGIESNRNQLSAGFGSNISLLDGAMVGADDHDDGDQEEESPGTDDDERGHRSRGSGSGGGRLHDGIAVLGVASLPRKDSMGAAGARIRGGTWTKATSSSEKPPRPKSMYNIHAGNASHLQNHMPSNLAQGGGLASPPQITGPSPDRRVSSTGISSPPILSASRGGQQSSGGGGNSAFYTGRPQHAPNVSGSSFDDLLISDKEQQRALAAATTTAMLSSRQSALAIAPPPTLLQTTMRGNAATAALGMAPLVLGPLSPSSEYQSPGGGAGSQLSFGGGLMLPGGGSGSQLNLGMLGTPTAEQRNDADATFAMQMQAQRPGISAFAGGSGSPTASGMELPAGVISPAVPLIVAFPNGGSDSAATAAAMTSASAGAASAPPSGLGNSVGLASRRAAGAGAALLAEAGGSPLNVVTDQMPAGPGSESCGSGGAPLFSSAAHSDGTHANDSHPTSAAAIAASGGGGFGGSSFSGNARGRSGQPVMGLTRQATGAALAFGGYNSAGMNEFSGGGGNYHSYSQNRRGSGGTDGGYTSGGYASAGGGGYTMGGGASAAAARASMSHMMYGPGSTSTHNANAFMYRMDSAGLGDRSSGASVGGARYGTMMKGLTRAFDSVTDGEGDSSALGMGGGNNNNSGGALTGSFAPLAQQYKDAFLARRFHRGVLERGSTGMGSVYGFERGDDPLVNDNGWFLYDPKAEANKAFGNEEKMEKAKALLDKKVNSKGLNAAQAAFLSRNRSELMSNATDEGYGSGPGGASGHGGPYSSGGGGASSSVYQRQSTAGTGTGMGNKSRSGIIGGGNRDRRGSAHMPQTGSKHQLLYAHANGNAQNGGTSQSGGGGGGGGPGISEGSSGRQLNSSGNSDDGVRGGGAGAPQHGQQSGRDDRNPAAAGQQQHQQGGLPPSGARTAGAAAAGAGGAPLYHFPLAAGGAANNSANAGIGDGAGGGGTNGAGGNSNRAGLASALAATGQQAPGQDSAGPALATGAAAGSAIGAAAGGNGVTVQTSKPPSIFTALSPRRFDWSSRQAQQAGTGSSRKHASGNGADTGGLSSRHSSGFLSFLLRPFTRGHSSLVTNSNQQQVQAQQQVNTGKDSASAASGGGGSLEHVGRQSTSSTSAVAGGNSMQAPQQHPMSQRGSARGANGLATVPETAAEGRGAADTPNQHQQHPLQGSSAAGATTSAVSVSNVGLSEHHSSSAINVTHSSPSIWQRLFKRSSYNSASTGRISTQNQTSSNIVANTGAGTPGGVISPSNLQPSMLVSPAAAAETSNSNAAVPSGLSPNGRLPGAGGDSNAGKSTSWWRRRKILPADYTVGC